MRSLLRFLIMAFLSMGVWMAIGLGVGVLLHWLIPAIDLGTATLTQLPHSIEQNPLSMRCCSVVSSLGDVLVPDLGLHDLQRNA